MIKTLYPLSENKGADMKSLMSDCYLTHTSFSRNFLLPLPPHPLLRTQKENLIVRTQTWRIIFCKKNLQVSVQPWNMGHSHQKRKCKTNWLMFKAIRFSFVFTLRSKLYGPSFLKKQQLQEPKMLFFHLSFWPLAVLIEIKLTEFDALETETSSDYFVFTINWN